MRLKFVEAVAGASWCYRPGEVHEVPEPSASNYLRGGIAVLADPEPEADVLATIAASERAAMPRRARR